LTLNFIGSGLEHFSEVIAERMTLLEVLAARFNNDSRIIAKTIKSYRRERRKPELTVVAEAVEATA
jgi:hypothetical protein